MKKEAAAADMNDDEDESHQKLVLLRLKPHILDGYATANWDLEHPLRSWRRVKTTKDGQFVEGLSLVSTRESPRSPPLEGGGLRLHSPVGCLVSCLVNRSYLLARSLRGRVLRLCAWSHQFPLCASYARFMLTRNGGRDPRHCSDIKGVQAHQVPADAQ